MQRDFKTLWLVLMIAAAPISASAEADACFADWSAATIVIKAESLVTVDQLTKLAPAKFGGDIVRTTLCEAKSGFIYKIVVKDRGGQLRLWTVDAKHPFDR
jgi:hypothetical protein